MKNFYFLWTKIKNKKLILTLYRKNPWWHVVWQTLTRLKSSKIHHFNFVFSLNFIIFVQLKLHSLLICVFFKLHYLLVCLEFLFYHFLTWIYLQFTVHRLLICLQFKLYHLVISLYFEIYHFILFSF